MAKDVRHFVQNFNMSRQLSDQKQFPFEEIETIDSPTDDQKRTKKRSDWTDGGDCRDRDAQGPVQEAEIEGLFFQRRGAEKRFKPLFLNRNNAERHQNDHSQDIQYTEIQQTSCGRTAKRRHQDIFPDDQAITLHTSEKALKWNRLRAQIQERQQAMQLTWIWRSHVTATTKRGKEKKDQFSKWSSFITEEDNGCLETRGRGASWDGVSQRSNDLFELIMSDERVEDDIHPDFL
ncbi:UNVERIFIED_CONTAM: hypothetical protein Slati_2518100 [Sesamum latifolium]|uniref:Uncharacterized protein n=1 Tax=Sesamum latifolium TaxID=2727402 RepID=A0AAW2WKM8_9LAMI